tara:strand:+ start:1318 stop:1869 length:552 start_codon:yes stop_codon:yes gene_type:complete
MEFVKINQNQKILRSLIVIFFGSIALTVSAKLKIPFYPVPMTMQTFVVLFLGISFGYKIGVATVGLYLFEGIIGIPVFSNSPEKGFGLSYFIGPTMGYLVGFLFATFFAGYLNFKTNIIVIFLKLIFSVSIIYIFGLLWLGNFVGWGNQLFTIGVFPFLLAELFKISILTLLVKVILNFRRFI